MNPPTVTCSCREAVIDARLYGCGITLEPQPDPAGPVVLALRDGAVVAENFDEVQHAGRRRWTSHRCQTLPGGTLLAAIDFETADSKPDSACAVGVALVQGGQVTGRRHWLIRPVRRPAQGDDFEWTHVHGLKWSDVEHAELFRRVWPDVEAFVVGTEAWVAHNAPFDRKVAFACCDAAGLMKPKQPWIDTVKLARQHWQLSAYKLDNVAAHLGIKLDHHQADSDAEACARVLLAAAGRDGSRWDWRRHGDWSGLSAQGSQAQGGAT